MKKPNIRYWSSKFGKQPLCNGKRHRGIVIGKFCFPLCTRCTSIIISFMLCYYLLPNIPLNFWIILLLLSPTLIDGFIQYKLKVESTNFRRLLLGIPCGIGLNIVIKSIENGKLWNLFNAFWVSLVQ